MLTQFTKQVLQREILDEYIENHIAQNKSKYSGGMNSSSKKHTTAKKSGTVGTGNTGDSMMSGGSSHGGSSMHSGPHASIARTVSNVYTPTVSPLALSSAGQYNAQTEQLILEVRDTVHTLVYPICSLHWQKTLKDAMAVQPQ